MSGPVERPIRSVVMIKDYGLFFVVVVIVEKFVFLACPSTDNFHRSHKLFGKATFPMISIVKSIRYCAARPWVPPEEVGSIYRENKV